MAILNDEIIIDPGLRVQDGAYELPVVQDEQKVYVLIEYYAWSGIGIWVSGESLYQAFLESNNADDPIDYMYQFSNEFYEVLNGMDLLMAKESKAEKPLWQSPYLRYIVEAYVWYLEQTEKEAKEAGNPASAAN